MATQAGGGSAKGVRPATEAEARALASTIRLRILRLTIDASLTNKEIAERLGANPASTLHHVRQLVDAGFLLAEPARRGRRGAREVPYRGTGKSWTLDVGDSPREHVRDAALGAFLEEIRGLDLASEQVTLTRLAVRLTQDELAELRVRVWEVLDEYRARADERTQTGTGREDTTPYGVFFMMHPDRR